MIVTRGDVDLTPILESLPFDDVIVWDNRKHDCKVLGRYDGMFRAKHDTVYVQDDDCIVPVDALLEQYEEGDRLCNMSRDRWEQYPDSSLLGWGALFPRRDSSYAFALYSKHYSTATDEFYRCCDVVFTTLMPFRRIDVGHEDLPWATAPERMYHQPNHYIERKLVLGKARRLLAVAA